MSVRWSGLVARKKEKRNAYKVLVQNVKDNFEDLDADERIILKWISGI
jgi:hypothetical protein